MYKAKELVNPLANKLTEVKSQTSLEALIDVKAEVLVVGYEEALANKMTHSIT